MTTARHPDTCTIADMVVYELGWKDNLLPERLLVKFDRLLFRIEKVAMEQAEAREQEDVAKIAQLAEQNAVLSGERDELRRLALDTSAFLTGRSHVERDPTIRDGYQRWAGRLRALATDEQVAASQPVVADSSSSQDSAPDQGSNAPKTRLTE